MLRTAGLLLLLTIASASALPVLEDPAGDVEADHWGQAQTGLPSGWEAMDLRGLDITEDPAGFRFTVTAEQLHGDDDTRTDKGNHFVYFDHGGQWYVVRLQQSADNGAPWATLHVIDTPEQVLGPQVALLDVALDTAAATISAHVPRELLPDAEGTPPERGHRFEGVFVIANAHTTGIYAGIPDAGLEGGPALIGDRMPDADFGAFDVALGGGTSSGPIALEVSPAFRVSNGEATTYRIDATVSNLDGVAREFRFMADGLQRGWELHAGGDQLRVEGTATATFPLFLTVPFAHGHGTVVDFQVHVHRSDDEAIFAAEQVGVHYHAVPQPAGHHDTLYFHSRSWSETAGILNPPLGGTNGVLSMTTIDEDGSDARVPIRGFTRFGPERVDRWAVCLEPGLLMGLDFDLDRIGELSIPFTSTVPVDGTLQADLVWVAPGEDPTWCTPFGFSERDQVVLASATESVSAGAGTGTTVTAQITPEPAADRIERADGADLVLMLTLTSAVPATGGAGGVDLMPGGSLELPLLEYHDVLPAVLPSANNTVEDDPEDVFVDDEPRKESPGVGLLAVLGLLALAGRVARKR